MSVQAEIYYPTMPEIRRPGIPKIFRKFIQTRNELRDYRRLDCMTDRELADIGVNRDQIGRYRRDAIHRFFI